MRHLIDFSGGGSGMRYLDSKLEAGDELTEGAQRYTLERVEQPPNPTRLGMRGRS